MAVSELTQSTNQNILNELEDIHTMLIGKIISIDNEKRTADIHFLQKVVKTSKGFAMQTITGDQEEVPISPIFESQLFSIWAPYAVGDKVIIQISERPLYEPLTSPEISEQQMMGRCQIGYGIIMKPLPQNLLEETQKEADSLYIEHKQTGNYFKFDSSGNIEIFANVTITGNLELNGNEKINGELEVSGNSTAADHISGGISGKDHIHSGVTAGSDKTQKPE